MIIQVRLREVILKHNINNPGKMYDKENDKGKAPIGAIEIRLEK